MSLAVCKFYLKNQKCRFGEHCRFKHSIDPRPPPQDHNTCTKHENHGKAVTSGSSIVSTYQKGDLSENLKNEDFVDRFAQSSLDPLAASFDPSSNQKENESASVRHQQSKRQIQPQKKVCQYFVQHGTCAFGRSCWFSHTIRDDFTESRQSNQAQNKLSYKPQDRPPRFQRQNWRINSPSSPIALRSVSDETQKHDSCQAQDDIGQAEFKGRISRQQCHLFKSGSCKKGKDCRFSHDIYNAERSYQKDTSNSSESRNNIQEQKGDKLVPSEKESSYAIGENRGSGIKQERCSFYKRPALRQVLKLSELEEEGDEQYRQYDINYLQKRFPKSSVLESGRSNNFILQATFSPSDPDWPFDITAFELEFTLKESYPVDPLTLKVLGGDNIPETVRRYLEVSISEWLMERSAGFAERREVELVARPFLRWLDRRIEDIITEAMKQLKRELLAKAAGLEFIPAEKLQARYRSESGSIDTQGDESGSEDNEYEEDTGSSEEDSYSSEDTDSESEEERGFHFNLDPEKRGTEIALRNLQLKEKATSLLFDRLKIILQCSRCKNHEDVNIMPGKVLSVNCGKCNHEMLATYRASLAHQLCSVIGYLDLDNCTAFDLIFQDCKAAVTCLNCSKQTSINGLVSGQLVDGWCQACNARFKIATDAVKFSHLAPSGVDISRNTKMEVVHQKAKKPPKDPNIKEGCPLPDFGTCKHYKHSYRWLRFPCCGKAYPCDVCHDRKEDHEMVFANRMICGHCCKEQTFASTRPCTACGANLTKIHTAHWEGGSGCRDKITMSKNDTQKYRNMNKTISSHKKKVQSGGSKKKTTKLRHA